MENLGVAEFKASEDAKEPVDPDSSSTGDAPEAKKIRLDEEKNGEGNEAPADRVRPNLPEDARPHDEIEIVGERMVVEELEERNSDGPEEDEEEGSLNKEVQTEPVPWVVTDPFRGKPLRKDMGPSPFSKVQLEELSLKLDARRRRERREHKALLKIEEDKVAYHVKRIMEAVHFSNCAECGKDTWALVECAKCPESRLCLKCSQATISCRSCSEKWTDNGKLVYNEAMDRLAEDYGENKKAPEPVYDVSDGEDEVNPQVEVVPEEPVAEISRKPSAAEVEPVAEIHEEPSATNAEPCSSTN